MEFYDFVQKHLLPFRNSEYNYFLLVYLISLYVNGDFICVLQERNPSMPLYLTG